MLNLKPGSGKFLEIWNHGMRNVHTAFILYALIVLPFLLFHIILTILRKKAPVAPPCSGTPC